MKNEICYIILGKAKPYYIRGRLVKKVTGKPASVKFDGDWVSRREEKKGDVVGFWHTHPGGTLKPSARDRKTMKAWINCFGKPLLCVIQNSSHEAAYLVDAVKRRKRRYIWSRGALIYKIFRRRFRVYQ